jgi:hypothetical protein
MKLSKKTKEEINELIGEMPAHHLLNVKESSLTPKMLKYCENRARGETKAGSYRRAYKSKAKPTTVANKGYVLEKRDDIKSMINSYEEAIEWNTRYSLAQTKALVIARLTKEALSDESSPSARINALKALGTVAGVDAFIHRTETKVVKDSETAKHELMEQLKKAMGEQMRTIEQDDDELELLSAISAPAKRDGVAATPPIPDPHLGEESGSLLLHSNVDNQIPTQSQSETNGVGGAKNSICSPRTDAQEDTPSDAQIKG